MEQKEQEYKYTVVTRCFTFNHAPYIVDAMNGFAMQETTFPVYYLITDDASTDGEPKVIRQYLAEHFQAPFRIEETDDYHLICTIHQTNPNCIFIVFLLKYNHYSIKKSKLPYQSEWSDNAKYIALCEGDDYWSNPLKIEKQIQVLEKNPRIVLCHTSYRLFYEYEKTFYNPKDIDVNSAIIKSGITPEDILDKYKIQYCTVIIRKSALQKAIKSNDFLFRGYFLMGDTQLWYRLYSIGEITFIPEIMAVCRKNDGSATRRNDANSYYRFRLSSSELRVYISVNDNLDKAFLKKWQKIYDRDTMIYKCLDPSFIPLMPSTQSFNPLIRVLAKYGLLKPIILFIFPLRKSMGLIKRKITNWCEFLYR